MPPQSASSLRRAALCVALLLAAACGCPPLVEGYDTPERTLLRWQAHLCRDDAQGEYGCLAASFQRAMNGYETYHAARAALLDDQPITARLFARADLLDYVVERVVDDESGRAVLRLSAGGQDVAVVFERETWLLIDWADGRHEAFNQHAQLWKLLIVKDNGQWLAIQRPALAPEALDDVRGLTIELRWKIANLAGLGDRASAAPVAARGALLP